MFLKKYALFSLLFTLSLQLVFSSDFTKSCEHLVNSFGNKSTTRFSRVKDKFLQVRPSQTYKKSYEYSKSNFKYFLDGPSFYDETNIHSKSEFYIFEIPLRDGTIHKISVVMDPDHYKYRGIENAEYASRLISMLPYKSIKATNLVELTPMKYFDPNGILIDRGQASSDGKIFLRLENFKNEEEALLHEHGHNIGFSLIFHLFGSPHPWSWRKTMKKDKGAPKVHTEGSAEDFAQSFAIYFMTNGGKISLELQEKYQHRFQAFDSIFDKL